MRAGIIITLLLTFSHFFLIGNESDASYWVGEAEDGILIGDPEVVESCASASNGKFVKLAGDNGKGVQFNNVTMDAAGSYQLNIHYYYVGTSWLEIFVNDQSVGAKELASANWCYQGASALFSTNIELNSGTNSIKLMVYQGKASPLIDKVEVLNPNKTILSIQTDDTTIIPGQSADIKISTDKEVTEELKVNLDVVGVDQSEYQLTPETVVIPKGAKETTVSYKALAVQQTENKTARIAISVSDENISVGEFDHVEIKVVAVSKTYYVSSSNGNDDNDGLSVSAPWKSFEKVNSIPLYPGYKVLFKRGDTFIGQLVSNGSGTFEKPITYSSYGTGDLPILDGAKADGGDYLATIYLNNHDHIHIDNLEITNERLVSRSGVSDNLAYGIYVHNSADETMNHFQFKHLTIRNIFALNIDGVEFNSIKVSAIYLKSEANNEAGKEKNINDVLVDSCFIERTTRYGIYSGHGGGAEGIGNDSINRNSNFVFRNNHFLHTGGSCITPGRTYNCLLENNIFEYPGSDIDSRMANRGSGAWFWNCRNVLAQYNRIYHVRGYGDSYCMHIDFGNENVIFQYNYSEDTEGGFVEILGKNINSVYRFNVSVNDGFRDKKGNSIWVSDYAGTNNKVTSDLNYVYNNTIYVDAAITPDILITGKNTYIYNNIFFATGSARIGAEVTIEIDSGSALFMENNLYFGNINTQFINNDKHPVYGNPVFIEAGAKNIEGYKVSETSVAIKAGKSFPEPIFSKAGKGIFKHISQYPEIDLYGNAVDISNQIPNIGAFNGFSGTGITRFGDNQEHSIQIYPNPVKGKLFMQLTTTGSEPITFKVTDLQGRVLQSATQRVVSGVNRDDIELQSNIRNGIYMLRCEVEGVQLSKRFVLYR